MAAQVRSCFIGLVVTSSLTALAAGAGLAQTPIELPQIVITASQVPVEAAKVGSSVSVITGEQLRQMPVSTVAEALRTVPGLAVGASGSRGSLTQVRVRGTESNHLKVMIDGVEASGPVKGEFDFADLPIDDVERIEVLRGPQSGLYGPNAHAGVVSIFTKSGRGLTTPEADIRLEGGSQNAWNGAIGARGQAGPVYGALTVSQLSTDGFNIARTGSERDGSRATQVTARGGVEFTPNFNVETALRYRQLFAGTDPQDYTWGAPSYGYAVDGEDTNRHDTWSGRVAANAAFLDGRWTHTLALSHLEETYRFRDTLLSDGNDTTRHQGSRDTLSYKTAYRFDTPWLGGASHTLALGADHEHETFKQFDAVGISAYGEKSREQTGVFGEWLTQLPFGLSLSAALRRDDFDGFEDATTWRVTAAQMFEVTGTKLRGSVGTGITKPSFYEQFGLYTGFIGNPNLVPERSLGWDAGIDQRLFDGKLRLGATYFQSELEDEIVYVGIGWSSFTYANAAGRSHRRGIELTAALDPLSWLSVNGSYTYTDATESIRSSNVATAGYREIRRPPHSGAVTAQIRFPDDKTRLSVTATYNGKVDDLFFGTFPNTRVTLPAWTVVSAMLSHDLTSTTTFYLKGENVFDEQYEEVYTYRAPGATVLAGMKVRFGR